MTASQRTSIGWATAALGLAGLVCGIVALAADIGFLGLIAGILALGAGAAGFAVAYVEPETPPERPPSGSSPARTTMPATPPAVPSGVDDDVTGLRSEAYFMAAASDRIDAARRYLRPVALMLMNVTRSGGNGVSPVDTGDTISTTLREADMICRRDDGSFAVLLEDTPETGALLVVERLRPALRGRLGDVIVHAGVACYPAHGLDLGQIWDLAESALAVATRSERDATEVAAEGD